MDDFFFDEPKAGEKGEFSTFEKAMTDTVVLGAGKIAAERAHVMTPEEDETRTVADENTAELDTMVAHVIKGPVTVSGMVQISSHGDESDRISADDAYGEFQGFVISRREGRIEYDYLFAIPTVDETHMLTRQEYIHALNGETDVETVTVIHVQARIGEVFMEFDAVHPVRAFAWLSEGYPEIINALDDILLAEGTAEEQIVGLKEFSYFFAPTLPEAESRMLQKSIMEYGGGLASIDREAPYLMDIDGMCIELGNEPKDHRRKDVKKTVLFSADYINLYSDNPSEENAALEGTLQSFAIVGRALGSHMDQPAKGMLVPISSITALRSLRVEDPDAPEETLEEEPRTTGETA